MATSIAYHPSFIVYTAVVPYKANTCTRVFLVDAAAISGDDNVHSTLIDTGARLLAAVADTGAVVLLGTRGDITTIYMRPMLMSIVKDMFLRCVC
jgi:hypothetical protein